LPSAQAEPPASAIRASVDGSSTWAASWAASPPVSRAKSRHLRLAHRRGVELAVAGLDQGLQVLALQLAAAHGARQSLGGRDAGARTVLEDLFQRLAHQVSRISPSRALEATLGARASSWSKA